MTDILVAGDVCDDVLIFGPVRRFSRDAAGLVVVDVENTVTIEGGAAAAFRQVEALGAAAFLVPTGRPAVKTRLIAVGEEGQRELARFDSKWPAQNPVAFVELMTAAGPDFAAALYSQYRPTPPAPVVIKQFRDLGCLRIGDVRDPSIFVGALDIVKVSRDDIWERLERPRPRRTPEGARKVARAVAAAYGFRWTIITLGPDGYVATNDVGTEILEGGIPGARRSVGAGDVFAATLTFGLAEEWTIQRALTYANVAAGIACRKESHLSTVTLEDIHEFTEGLRSDQGERARQELEGDAPAD